jgi:uridine kinase
MTPEQRDDHNFDHPDALDTDLLLEDLKKLKAGNSVDIPTYDFSTHMRTKKTLKVESHKIILVEVNIHIYFYI